MKGLIVVCLLALVGCQMELTDKRQVERCEQNDRRLEQAVYALASDLYEVRQVLKLPEKGVRKQNESIVTPIPSPAS